MPTTINPVAYIIGAAEVYYRALGSTAAWTSIGATVDEVVFRATQTMFNPSDTINGLDDLIQGMDYRTGGSAEVEFTMPELAGPKLALALPGATSTTLATTAAGGGGSSTLSAATVVGATSVTVALVTNFVAGDYIKIDTGASAEYRVITLVAGSVLSFRDPLLLAHASGVAVVETVGDGKTEIIASTVRRQPDSAYNDWALVAQSPADYYELYLYRGLSSTETAEISFGDETMAGIRVTIGGHKTGTDLTLPSWKLRVPAA